MRLLSLLLAVASAASCQTAAEILRSTADTYQSIKTYRFEAEYWAESATEEEKTIIVTTRIAAADLPNHLRRIEWKGGPLASVRIYDGHTVWQFRKGANQFTQADQAAYRPRSEPFKDPVETYKALDQIASNARLVRVETIEAAGAQRPCWVVEAPPPDSPADNLGMQERLATTYWIDQSTHLVLKESERARIKSPRMDVMQTQTLMTTYKVASVNEPVSANLFRFQPPQGATEVAEFPRPSGPGTPLPNTASPDFALSDLNGQTLSLSSFKGKAVLVNFWATWCEPCTQEMPEIEATQRQFADKGFVVLAIDDGETPERVKKFIGDHGYTFRVLLDRDESVGHKFSVSGLPAMFFIDREGNIRAQYRGYNTRNLMEDLKKIDVQ